MAQEILPPFLEHARSRGDDLLKGLKTPAGIGQLTTYVGLVQTAMELAKVIESENRDLEAIKSYYAVETQRLESAFSEIEMALKADVLRDKMLHETTMLIVNKLVDAQQYDTALAFFDRMTSNFSGSALDKILTKHSRTTLPGIVELRRAR